MVHAHPEYATEVRTKLEHETGVEVHKMTEDSRLVVLYGLTAHNIYMKIPLEDVTTLLSDGPIYGEGVMTFKPKFGESLNE